MNSVLITGGAGFIGSHLVDELLDQQVKVTIVDDFNTFYDPEVKRENIKKYLNTPNFKVFEADIRNSEALKPVFNDESYDTVVHLAARAGVRPSLQEPVLYYETNVLGTLNLLEQVRTCKIPQFIFGSSSSVYGNCKDFPFKESFDISKTISPYASTKAAGESLCYSYSHLYNIQVVCLRFFTVYGPRQRPDLAIHKFTDLIYHNNPLPLFGDGSTCRDYTYIDDIIQGIMAAMDYHDSSFEIFNLGESRTILLKDMIALLEERIGKKAIIENHPPQPGDVDTTYADITRARKFLGYNPQYDIEEGLANFVDWYKAGQMTL